MGISVTLIIRMIRPRIQNWKRIMMFNGQKSMRLFEKYIRFLLKFSYCLTKERYCTQLLERKDVLLLRQNWIYKTCKPKAPWITEWSVIIIIIIHQWVDIIFPRFCTIEIKLVYNKVIIIITVLVT